MKHVKINAFDCPDAWYKTLSEIWQKGEIFKVGYGSEATETKKLNLSIEIEHPENRPLVHEKAPCDMNYLYTYTLRYLWSELIEEGETYTYGSRLRNPIDQIAEAVKRYVDERNDRQVTLVIRRPEDILKEIDGKKHEPPCLTMIDTEISDNKLHLTCYFRSWDAYAGLPANIAGIQLLNEAIVKEINELGNDRYSNWENISTGKLIFHSKNCHIYERQYKLIEELFKANSKTHMQRIKNL